MAVKIKRVTGATNLIFSTLPGKRLKWVGKSQTVGFFAAVLSVLQVSLRWYITVLFGERIVDSYFSCDVGIS